MRHLQALLLVVLTASFGCARHNDSRFTIGRGDAGQFILQHAIARGGIPITTNNLPTITGPWSHCEDKYGVMVRLARHDYDPIETLLRQAFGLPSFGPSPTSDGGKLGGYRLTPKGGALQFGYSGSEAQVIVLRQLTREEFADAIGRAAREMEKTKAR